LLRRLIAVPVVLFVAAFRALAAGLVCSVAATQWQADHQPRRSTTILVEFSLSLMYF
jgi:hypothetical protein